MVLYDSPGLAPLRPLGYLFVRTKRYQKAAGGVPPVPPASPSGRYSIGGFICVPTELVWFCRWCLPFVCRPRGRHSAFRRTTGPATQAPPVYPQVLTGAKQRGECGADLLRSDSVGPPCRGYPFKRPAGVQWPTATSNPKPPVAAHGRSWMRARPPDQNPVGNFRSRGAAAPHLGACS